MNRILLIWALLASFVAVGAIGYSLGKGAAAESVPARLATDSSPVSSDGSRVEPTPSFTVPALFEAAPREWRTAVVRGRADGYAALFDPLRREIIVEQCRHPGYEIDGNGRPVEHRTAFCTPVLWAQLDELTESTATALDRRGQRIAIRLRPDLEATPPSLGVSFQNHDMTLVPGSKNDLYQALDAEPAMQSARRAYLMALASGGASDSARRQADERSTADVPRYTLPAASAPPADEEENGATPADTQQ